MGRGVRIAAAAKQLGISHEFLLGLIISKRIDGWKAEGRTGEPVWMISEATLTDLRQMIGTWASR